MVALHLRQGRHKTYPYSQKSYLHSATPYIHPETESLQDKGYRGIQKLHANSRWTVKKPKGGVLSPADKTKNRELAGERIGIEHVNRRFKIFRILAERYRNRHRRHGLRCNLIAALYDNDCKCSTG